MFSERALAFDGIHQLHFAGITTKLDTGFSARARVFLPLCKRSVNRRVSVLSVVAFPSASTPRGG